MIAALTFMSICFIVGLMIRVKTGQYDLISRACIGAGIGSLIVNILFLLELAYK